MAGRLQSGGTSFMRNIWDPWRDFSQFEQDQGLCPESSSLQDAPAFCRMLSLYDPLRRSDRDHKAIRSGETVYARTSPDFFSEKTDPMREDAWNVIRERPDVIFFLSTELPYRISRFLPEDWGSGWENVVLSVIFENQQQARERAPALLRLPFRHKAIMALPLKEQLSVERYLKIGCIEQVLCGGDREEGASYCDFQWIKTLHDECVRYGVFFRFLETGSLFKQGGIFYHIPDPIIQRRTALLSGICEAGKKPVYRLSVRNGGNCSDDCESLHRFRRACFQCPSSLVCAGCCSCGLCTGKEFTETEFHSEIINLAESE